MDILLDACRDNDTNEIVEILNEINNINLIKDNDDCLHFGAKYKNAAMMEALLKYFYEVQLPQINNKYLRKDTENKLKEILDDVESSWVITEEIEQVINKYLNSKEETKLDYLDNNSELSLNEDLVNKVINQNSPEKFNELEETADTIGDSPKSNKSAFSLNDKLDINYVKNVMHQHHLDSTCHNFSQVITYNDDFSIDYSAYFSQQMNDTCLGNSDTSTQDSSPERELSGESNANTNITEFV